MLLVLGKMSLSSGRKLADLALCSLENCKMVNLFLGVSTSVEANKV